MQASIVQSPTGTVGVEVGNILPSKPTTEGAFGALFSQLLLDDSIIESELDESELSDTEIPDAFTPDTDLKEQQPQITRTEVLSNHEISDVAKKTGAAEAMPRRALMSEIPLTTPQITILDSGKQKIPAIVDNPFRSATVEAQTSKTPSMQQSAVTVSSGFQIAQAEELPAQGNGLRVQDLRQVSSNTPIEKPNPVPMHANTQTPIDQNNIRHLDPDIEHVKNIRASSVDGNRIQHFAPQKSIEWNKSQPSALPTMTVTHTQTQPLNSTPVPVTNVSVQTAKSDAVVGEAIDNNIPAVETIESEFGRTNVSQNLPATATPEQSRAGAVRYAGTQMVDALIRQPDQPVEIALNPEELGRVRISLSHLDTGLTVAIAAERPETLELMRRYIKQLETEFRQLGYENISFEFSGSDTNSSEQSESENQPSTDQVTEAPDSNTHSPVSPQTTGVDIRL